MGSERDQGSGSLDILEDPAFQHREWKAQRVGWAVLVLVMLAALAGVLGPGPLSHSTVTSDDGTLSVNYARFARSGGQGDITLELTGDAGTASEVRLLVSRSYIEQMTVDSISPEPAEQILVGDDAQLTIPLSAPAVPVTVQLSLTPKGMGSVHGTIAIEGGASVSFSQFLYP